MELIKTRKDGIDYLVHPKESIFAGMMLRANPEDAFDNAIKRGMKNPDDWMYMYSDNGRDYFKHHDTRIYKSYPQFGPIERIKKHLSRER